MPETKKYADEMLRMQNDAARRVQEMERRSKSAVQELNGERVQKPQPPDPPPAVNTPPLSAPSNTHLQQGEETERMFLLSLCLLLSAEGADEALVIALLYLIGG